MAAKVMEDLGFSNLGFINVSIMYLGLTISSMLAIPINRKIGSKLTLFISGITFAIYIAGFLLPAYQFEGAVNLEDNTIIAINLICALIVGFGAACIWVS